MGKIFCLMGKSASGKDTIFRRLLENKELALKTLVPYTTRPIRDGEKNGREYFFTDIEGLNALRDAGKVIEERVYQTWHGPWHYFTVNDGQIHLESGNYLQIGTLEAYVSIRDYFGEETVVPLFIDLDDGERLQRALDREKAQEKPKYEEMCRRFLGDAEDFREEKIAAAGIGRRFYNNDLEECLDELTGFIVSNIAPNGSVEP